MTEHRRIRTRLSIGETDAQWLNTATNYLYRFDQGQWQHSVNIYYGKDCGWSDGMNWEPQTSHGHVFIEMLPDQQQTDPQFVEIIAQYRSEANHQ